MIVELHTPYHESQLLGMCLVFCHDLGSHITCQTLQECDFNKIFKDISASIQIFTGCIIAEIYPLYTQ